MNLTYSPISSPIQIIGIPILVICNTTPRRTRLNASSPKISFSLPKIPILSLYSFFKHQALYLILRAFDHDHDCLYNSPHLSHRETLAVDNQYQPSIDQYRHYHKVLIRVMSNRNYHANLEEFNENQWNKFPKIRIYIRPLDHQYLLYKVHQVKTLRHSRMALVQLLFSLLWLPNGGNRNFEFVERHQNEFHRYEILPPYNELNLPRIFALAKCYISDRKNLINHSIKSWQFTNSFSLTIIPFRTPGH